MDQPFIAISRMNISFPAHLAIPARAFKRRVARLFRAQRLNGKS
jgi:hypothetical protein